MFTFLLKRIGIMIPTFLGVTLIAFSLIHLIPGDPVEAMMGERGIDPARHEELKVQLGLDKSLPVQYLTYLKNVASGNFGTSVVTNESVLKEFFSRFPATVELSLLAILLATLVGVPAGVIAATRRGKLADHGLMGAALTGYSMPIFWWGLLLILLFSVTLGWTPVSGRIGFAFDVPPRTGFLLIDSLLSGEAGAFKSALSHLILPTIVLATVPLAVIARMTRSSMLEVLREDYIRAARAKGVSRAKLIFVHALRNALIPVVTVIGLQIGTLLSGAILTETIFSWPGIGKWLIESISRRDYQVVQGGILLIASLIIVVNLLVDVLYGVINPRIRSSH
ncbi:MAG: ABC transporter permease subunit [Burkholderiales bacterium]